MAFVPTAPPRREASARAQDLGRRLKAEIEKFEAQYPGTSPEDIRAAAAIAVGEELVAVPPQRRIAAALGAGIAALGVLAALFMGRGAGGGNPSSWPAAQIGIVVGIVAVLSVRWMRRR